MANRTPIAMRSFCAKIAVGRCRIRNNVVAFGIAAGAVERALLNITGSDGDLRALQCASESCEAFLRVCQMQRASDSRQSAMPELNEVLRGAKCAVFIGNRNRITFPVTRHAVETNDSGPRASKGLHMLAQLAEVGRNDNESGWQISAELAEMLQFLCVIVICIA